MKAPMFFGARKFIFANANDLRKNMTEAEKLLWFQLKEKKTGFKFRRQHPLSNYIADFYCHVAKLVIELDGSIHNLAHVKQNDAIRQTAIEECGLTVLRFTNEEVFQNTERVLDTIRKYLIVSENK